MHEELENFERKQVWELIDPPQGVSRLVQSGCGRTKRERKGEVVRNKSRLVA
jgi:hypothetical protein